MPAQDAPSTSSDKTTPISSVPTPPRCSYSLSPVLSPAPPVAKKKKKKRKKAKEQGVQDSRVSQQSDSAVRTEYDSDENSHSGYNTASYRPPSELPPPVPVPLKNKSKGIVTEIHASVSIQLPRKNKEDRIWNTSSGEERERIKEFWLQLGEEERRSLVKVEKDAVLKKMKEQQKHTCSCTVCGRKRNAIEEELEVLYNAYYEELEQYANHQRQYGVRALPSAFTGTAATQEDDEEYGEEEYVEEEYSGTEDDRRPDFFNFGNSLTVKGGILTVADDLLRNDGKKFIDMMEQLAERRMQREEEATIEAQAEYEDDEDYVDDEDDDEEDDEYDDEEEAVSEEQRMAEGRRMFQVFAARMFEQRVLHAYREKVAQERQRRLLEELEEESRKAETRELRKAREKEKKKDKRRLEKQRKEEERRQREAEALKLEEQRREQEAAKLEEQRKRREEQRARREAERRAVEEEKQRREEEKRRRQVQEREREQEKQLQREKKQREKQDKLKEKKTGEQSKNQSSQSLVVNSERSQSNHEQKAETQTFIFPRYSSPLAFTSFQSPRQPPPFPSRVLEPIGTPVAPPSIPALPTTNSTRRPSEEHIPQRPSPIQRPPNSRSCNDPQAHPVMGSSALHDDDEDLDISHPRVMCPYSNASPRQHLSELPWSPGMPPPTWHSIGGVQPQPQCGYLPPAWPPEMIRHPDRHSLVRDHTRDAYRSVSRDKPGAFFPVNAVYNSLLLLYPASQVTEQEMLAICAKKPMGDGHFDIHTNGDIPFIRWQDSRPFPLSPPASSQMRFPPQ